MIKVIFHNLTFDKEGGDDYCRHRYYCLAENKLYPPHPPTNIITVVRTTFGFPGLLNMLLCVILMSPSPNSVSLSKRQICVISTRHQYRSYCTLTRQYEAKC